MKKKEVLFVGIIVILAILSFLYFDESISQCFENIRNYFLTDLFMGITYVSSGVIIFFILTSLFLWKEHKRKWILPLWITLALSAIVSFLLKIVIQRSRPYQIGVVSSLLEEASHNIWNFSFPSFQTMLAFCAIPILSKEFPKLKNAWVIFAVLIAISRVYLGVHFMSDILIGGLIGYFLGVFVISSEKKNKFWEKTYKKIFKKN